LQVNQTGNGSGQETAHSLAALRKIALRELKEVGLEDPSELAISIRVRTLSGGDGEARTGKSSNPSHGEQRSNHGKSDELARFQEFGQRQMHTEETRISDKRKGEAEEPTDGHVPYYFAALPDEYIDHFAPHLPTSAALVLWILWRYAKQDMQTWVSQKTLSRKSGISENTVKRDLNLLRECNIVTRTYAGGRDFKGNSIRKTRGYKYRLTPPVAWGQTRARELEWRRGRRKAICG
jgi:hypothetical protein